MSAASASAAAPAAAMAAASGALAADVKSASHRISFVFRKENRELLLVNWDSDITVAIAIKCTQAIFKDVEHLEKIGKKIKDGLFSFTIHPGGVYYSQKGTVHILSERTARVVFQNVFNVIYPGAPAPTFLKVKTSPPSYIFTFERSTNAASLVDWDELVDQKTASALIPRMVRSIDLPIGQGIFSLTVHPAGIITSQQGKRGEQSGQQLSVFYDTLNIRYREYEETYSDSSDEEVRKITEDYEKREGASKARRLNVVSPMPALPPAAPAKRPAKPGPRTIKVVDGEMYECEGDKFAKKIDATAPLSAALKDKKGRIDQLRGQIPTMKQGQIAAKVSLEALEKEFEAELKAHNDAHIAIMEFKNGILVEELSVLLSTQSDLPKKGFITIIQHDEINGDKNKSLQVEGVIVSDEVFVTIKQMYPSSILNTKFADRAKLLKIIKDAQAAQGGCAVM